MLESHHLPLVFLMISVREKGCEPVGYGSLSLHMSLTFDSPFAVVITKDGVALGEFTGQFQVRLDEKGPPPRKLK